MENPEGFRPLLDDLLRCMDAYNMFDKNQLDAVIWRGPQLTQEGGEAVLEAYERLDTDLTDVREKWVADFANFPQLRQYWIENFQMINYVVYKGE